MAVSIATSSSSDSQHLISQRLISLLQSKFGNQATEIKLDLSDVVMRLPRVGMLDFIQILKIDTELSFDFFVSVTAVDWMDKAQERFEVVYHFLSTTFRHRLRVKIWVPEVRPEVDTLTDLWPGADFMERECWDMYGINFKGHPNQRRILMYDEFVGHPLRKDYPLQAKQPRIPLRSPEVTNTARDMKRQVLFQINKNSTNKQSSSVSNG